MNYIICILIWIETSDCCSGISNGCEESGGVDDNNEKNREALSFFPIYFINLIRSLSWVAMLNIIYLCLSREEKGKRERERKSG
jgi:hypothetical protein